ncbi:MAG: cation transporter [Myxococcales bacterium]|nr:cation transporter [Myxococcales bacterium]
MKPQESLFAVPKMDCPSEERMIRVALDGVAGVGAIVCDLAGRRVRVRHDGGAAEIAARLDGLGLGATLIETAEVGDGAGAGDDDGAVDDPVREARTLRLVLAINAVMFVAELVTAWFAQSAGLLADSLDMFADAAVYGLALYAVGRAARARVRTAHVAGWLQAVLAVGALVEVVRRFVAGSEPEPPLIMAVASVALVANVVCLWLVSRHKAGGAHMKASVIFSTNDVIANLGVIGAGALVGWTGSRYPDLVIGGVIAGVVLLGARRILRLR